MKNWPASEKVEYDFDFYLSRGGPRPKQSDMNLMFMLLAKMRMVSKCPVAANFVRMKTNTFHKKYRIREVHFRQIETCLH